MGGAGKRGVVSQRALSLARPWFFLAPFASPSEAGGEAAARHGRPARRVQVAHQGGRVQAQAERAAPARGRPLCRPDRVLHLVRQQAGQGDRGQGQGYGRGRRRGGRGRGGRGGDPVDRGTRVVVRVGRRAARPKVEGGAQLLAGPQGGRRVRRAGQRGRVAGPKGPPARGVDGEVLRERRRKKEERGGGRRA